jgi:hypothetical protein
MTAKEKNSSRIAPPTTAKKPKGASMTPLPLTVEEHVHRIEALSQRIDAYIRFMCQLAGEPGTSAEVKERALAVFHHQMIVVERQLGLIYDELRLE